MGFLKTQQVKIAIRLLSWQYTNAGRSLPDAAQLNAQAVRLVDDAHRIARERGGNVIAILKTMAAEALRRP